MSRVGKQPIALPKGVTVNISADKVLIQGPKGKLEQAYLPQVEIKQEADHIVVIRKDESKASNALSGLYRNLINNMVSGVTTGFSRVLMISGVGYRAELNGKNIVFNLGYSNPFIFVLPEGITATVDANTKITLNGIDKQLVGQTASEIRSLRAPEPYKGKGIKYEEEHIRRKVGKSGVK